MGLDGFAGRRPGTTSATRAASSATTTTRSPPTPRRSTLKPGYPDALEYRGEAYLGLNRIPDAQQAYLDLYAGNRALAGKLLSAMKAWSTAQRAAAANVANLDDFDKWIQEREQIAGQTAALTRAGTAASWR